MEGEGEHSHYLRSYRGIESREQPAFVFNDLHVVQAPFQAKLCHSRLQFHSSVSQQARAMRQHC